MARVLYPEGSEIQHCVELNKLCDKHDTVNVWEGGVYTCTDDRTSAVLVGIEATIYVLIIVLALGL